MSNILSNYHNSNTKIQQHEEKAWVQQHWKKKHYNNSAKEDCHKP